MLPNRRNMPSESGGLRIRLCFELSRRVLSERQFEIFNLRDIGGCGIRRDCHAPVDVAGECENGAQPCAQGYTRAVSLGE